MIDNNKHDTDVNTTHIDDVQNQKSIESMPKADNVIISKDDQIMQLEIKLAQLQEREKDIVLRLKAEIENMRRRNTQEIEKIHKFALERFVLELLPVIDNLERTVDIIDRSNSALSAITEGIDLTLKSFVDTVRKFGVTSIHDIHVPFNPELHQAISTIESEEYEPNRVLTIIQKGYTLSGRLIRPAMVTVSCAKL